MKAIQFSETGKPEVLQLVDLETPQPSDNQVLVKVAAVGVNFGETMQRAGTYPILLPLPVIPGSEVAGTIAALGSAVSGLPIGTRVAAMIPTQIGGYAQYCVVDAKDVIPLSDEIDFPEATALLSQGLTAYYLLNFATKLKPGDSVLIHAAAGGVGSIAVQLAKIMGARKVIGTASSKHKLDLLQNLGADIGINYTQANWVEEIKEATNNHGVDIILDSVGGQISKQSFQCLAPFGRMIVYGALSLQIADFTAQQIMQLVYGNQVIAGFALPNLIAAQPKLAQEGFRALLEYFTNGKLNIVVRNTFPLAEARIAHKQIEERQTTGKVVLIV